MDEALVGAIWLEAVCVELSQKPSYIKSKKTVETSFPASR